MAQKAPRGEAGDGIALHHCIFISIDITTLLIVFRYRRMRRLFRYGEFSFSPDRKDVSNVRDAIATLKPSAKLPG
jgi:hypothetical protein